VEALIRIYQAAGEPACAVRLRRYGDEIRDGAPMTREDVDGLRRDLIVLGRNPAKAESNGPSAN
jgi:hypothetical protein